MTESSVRTLELALDTMFRAGFIYNKNMKKLIDSIGPFALYEDGEKSWIENTMTKDEHAAFIKKQEALLPGIVNKAETEMSELISNLLKQDMFLNLRWAFDEFFSMRLNVTINHKGKESAMGQDEANTQYFVLFLQNILAKYGRGKIEQFDKAKYDELREKFYELNGTFSYIKHTEIFSDKTRNRDDLRQYVLYLNENGHVRGECYPRHALETLEVLLNSSSLVFKKKTGVSVAEYISGLKKMELAGGTISNSIMGKLHDLWKETTSEEYFDKFQDFEEYRKEIQQKSEREIFNNLDIFDVIKNTGWNESFVKELSWDVDQLNVSDIKFTRQEFLKEPKIAQKPFFNSYGRYFNFDPMFYDYEYKVLWKFLQTKLTEKENTLWNKNRAKSFEDFVVKTTKKCFNSKGESFQNLYYANEDGQPVEVDALYVNGSDVYLIESKSALMVSKGGETYDDKYKTYIKNYIEKARDQLEKVQTAVAAKKSVSLYEDPNFRKHTIDLTNKQNLWTICVTLEQLGSFTSDLKKMIGKRTKMLVFSIYDYLVFGDLFRSDKAFKEYLVSRLKAQDSSFGFDDELDHLGLFIARGDYVRYLESFAVKGAENWNYGYRDMIDKYYHTLIQIDLSEAKSFLESSEMSRLRTKKGKLSGNEKCYCLSGKKMKKCDHS